ncbi:MAG: histidine kinase, partial [Planctomycetota bacterium]|nr:histidine kinase [Planctomycetota bacterium]
ERAGGERAGGERAGGERAAWNRGPMGFDRRMERGTRNQSAGLLDRLLTHAFLLLLCGAGASYLRSQDTRRRVAKLSLERATLEAELGQARLSALESQLRPHFLFNALHSVGALVGAERNTEARAALVTLGDLLRLTLDRSSDGQSTLAQERDLCQSYLDLEKMRYGERLESTVKIPKSQENRSVPPLILLPLVENCVRHAVSKSSETVTIELEASEAGEQLRLDVTCSQGSFPSEVLAQGHGEGIGLANTRARLAATLGDTAQMQLENLPGGGTRVRLRLPLNTES